MSRDVGELEERLQSLQVARSTLASALRALSDRLRQGQLVSTDDLASGVVDYDSRYRQLRSTLQVDEASAAPWSDCEQRIAALSRARTALAWVSDLLNLQVDEGSSTSLFTPLQDELQAVQTRLQAAPWDNEELIQQLTDGGHPLVTLAQFLKGRELMSDEAWTDSVERLTTAFGPQLATAIVRGRVQIAARD